MAREEILRLIGEVIVAGFDGTELNEHASTLIRKHKVRNIILFTRNVQSMQQLHDFNASLQAVAAEEGIGPLIICTDQENGIVRRVAPDLPGLPGNMALGATQIPQYAREIGRATGEQLRAAGVNMNLAPVLDVNNNPLNPVIGVRSYGDNPETVAAFAIETIHGMQEYGVITCGKHFPGHGDSSVDSHLALPTIDHDRDRLDAIELLPFRRAIEAGIDTIMTAHVVFPSVEPDLIPATISKRVLTGLLREELGFDGVVTTDCMEMNAISETIGVGEGAVQALIAGADMVMISHRLDRQEEAIHAIAEAVESGRLPLERLKEAAGRLQRLRDERLGTVEASAPDFDVIRSHAVVLQQKVGAKAVTLVKSAQPQVSLADSTDRKVAVVVDNTAPTMIAAGATRASVLPEIVQSVVGTDVQIVRYAPDLAGTAMEALRDVDVILAGVNGLQNPAYVEFVDQLASQHPSMVVFALQSPYDLKALPNVHTAIAIYENTPWMVEAGVKALVCGEFQGALPVTVNDELKTGTGVQTARG